MTGECQKGHTYYRCHTKGCLEKSIREDRLEHQILERLKDLQIAAEDRARISKALETWRDGAGVEEKERTLRLRISDASTRLDRLTDLLVAGTIDQDAYELRKQNTDFELSRLREEIRDLKIGRGRIDDQAKLIEIASDLANLFDAAPAPGKRRIVRNCLVDLSIKSGSLHSRPSEWLCEIRTGKFGIAHTETSAAFSDGGFLGCETSIDNIL